MLHFVGSVLQNGYWQCTEQIM